MVDKVGAVEVLGACDAVRVGPLEILGVSVGLSVGADVLGAELLLGG